MKLIEACSKSAAFFPKKYNLCSSVSQLQCTIQMISRTINTSNQSVKMRHDLKNSSNVPDSTCSESSLLTLAKKFNNFYFNGLYSNNFKPLFCQGHQIGLVSPEVENHISSCHEVFEISPDKIEICPGLCQYDEISAQIASALSDLRQKKVFTALEGWRNETYEIKPSFGQKSLFAMERSATCLFGLRQYGVDINGYVVDENGDISVWMQRRSINKPTWPGKLDNFVAGGLSTGLSVRETVIKETNEEANLPKHIATQMKPAGCVSFFFQSERGLFPNTEFVFDIELPIDFVPKNNDGEVDEFKLVPANKLVEQICDSDMKTTSCPVTLDFLIRKGIVNAETEPDLPELIELLHIPIHNLYK